MLKKILVILSAANKIELLEGHFHKTGNHLTEITNVLDKALDSGYRIDIATPNGKTPAIDPISRNSLSKSQLHEAKRILELISNINLPYKLSELTEEKLISYSGLFIPGGHAPLVDLNHHAEVSKILKHFHDHRKPTATLCHGQAALLSAIKNGTWIYKDYNMTCFPKSAEQDLENNILTGHLKYYLDDKLKECGANIEEEFPAGTPHTVIDRELITGQDPYASKNVGTIFLKALNQYLHA
jgi:putative intracellular protease/amidase